MNIPAGSVKDFLDRIRGHLILVAKKLPGTHGLRNNRRWKMVGGNKGKAFRFSAHAD